MRDIDDTQPRFLDGTQDTKDLGGPMEQADLVALTGELAGRRFPIGEKALIGRDAEAAVQVVGDDVSRRHAQVSRTSSNEFLIEDLKSRNGTLVNGVPIEVSPLRFGDKVQVGSKTLFVFTRHQALEAQLVQWQRMELITQMTAGMIHDFNNCMTVILGNIQNIQNSSESYVTDEYLRGCLTEMEIMAWEGVNLARKVLNFARGADRKREQVDLSKLAEDTLRLSRRSIPQNVKVEFALQPELKILGDRSDLMQVIINLVLNARDAMPDGGKLALATSSDHLDEAQARAARLPLAGDVVALRVKDSGTGMSEETRKRVFEPLFTTKAPGKGTGLGLSTVARIIESHNGGIAVESKLGKGSSFTIYFPVPPAAGAVAADETRSTLLLDGRKTEQAFAALEGGFVLLLQSDPVTRQRVANVILSLGCDVLHAGSIGEAMELYGKYHHRIRVVVLDIDPHSPQSVVAFRELQAVDRSVRILVNGAGGASGKELAEGMLTFLGGAADTATFREALTKALG
jgi:signal transduction histidine kinase